MAAARSRTGAASCGFFRISKIALRERCFCWSSVFTRAYVAAMPFFHTFSADSSHPGTCKPRNSPRKYSILQPASSSAPRVMSPLMPEKQSKYASFMGVRRRAVGQNRKKCIRREHFDSIGAAQEWHTGARWKIELKFRRDPFSGKPRTVNPVKLELWQRMELHRTIYAPIVATEFAHQL